jgi:hypothetical protein
MAITMTNTIENVSKSSPEASNLKGICREIVANTRSFPERAKKKKTNGLCLCSKVKLLHALHYSPNGKLGFCRWAQTQPRRYSLETAQLFCCAHKLQSSQSSSMHPGRGCQIPLAACCEFDNEKSDGKNSGKMETQKSKPIRLLFTLLGALLLASSS